MSTIGKVEAYFTGVASGYQTASSGAVWGIVRRREAAALTLALGGVAGDDVLELGSGAGFYTRLLLAQGARHVWAVDLSQRMLDELPRDGITPIQGDAARVDVGRRFRRLVSAGMLEFVLDATDALRNAARHADPGARLVLLVPSRTLLGRAYRRFHAGHGLTIRLFDRQSLLAAARESGWVVDHVSRAGPYSLVARLTRESAPTGGAG